MIRTASILGLLAVTACATTNPVGPNEQLPQKPPGYLRVGEIAPGVQGPSTVAPAPAPVAQAPQPQTRFIAERVRLALVEDDGRTTVNNPLTVPAPRDNVSPAVLASYQRAVAGTMLDPDATRFRNTRAVRDVHGTPGLCGEMNTKNGFGALTGWRPVYSPIIREGGSLSAVPWTVDLVGVRAIQERCSAS